MNTAKISFFDRETGEPVCVARVFDEVLGDDSSGLCVTTRSGRKLSLQFVSEPYFVVTEVGRGGIEPGHTLELNEEETEFGLVDSCTGEPVVSIMSIDDLQELQRNQTNLNRQNRKWDQGKLKYDLVLPEFLELMAEILTRGEINHPCEPDGTPSWQLVEPKAYENALFRHFQAYRKGEIIDPDPKMPTDHMGNIAVNAMFLWWFNRQKEKDNG